MTTTRILTPADVDTIIHALNVTAMMSKADIETFEKAKASIADVDPDRAAGYDRLISHVSTTLTAVELLRDEIEQASAVTVTQ